MQRKNQLSRNRDNRSTASAIRTEMASRPTQPDVNPRKEYDKSVKIRKIANGYTVTNLANSEQSFAPKLFDESGENDVLAILEKIFGEATV